MIVRRLTPLPTRLALVIALLASGCASPSTSLLEVLEVRAPGEPVLAADLFAGHAARWNYESLPDDAATVMRLVRDATDAHDASWVDEEVQRSRRFWRREPDGTIVMTAAIDERDRALTLFDPPLVIAWPSLPAGEPRTSAASMRVVDSRRPQRQRERGQATRTIEYVDDVVLRTPLGDLPTKRLEITFHADLRLADAEETETLYLAPGLGVVAMERSRTIRVLGLPGQTTFQTLRISGQQPPETLAGWTGPP